MQNGNTFMPLPQSDPMDLFSHRTNSSSESKFLEDSRMNSNPGTTSSHGSQRLIPNWSDILPPPPPEQPPPASPNATQNMYNYRRPSAQQVRKLGLLTRFLTFVPNLNHFTFRMQVCLFRHKSPASMCATWAALKDPEGQCRISWAFRIMACSPGWPMNMGKPLTFTKILRNIIPAVCMPSCLRHPNSIRLEIALSWPEMRSHH